MSQKETKQALKTIKYSSIVGIRFGIGGGRGAYVIKDDFSESGCVYGLDHKVISYIQRVTGRLLMSFLRQQDSADQTAQAALQSCQYNHITGQEYGCTGASPRPCSLISCVHWRRYDVTCHSLPSSMEYTLIYRMCCHLIINMQEKFWKDKC